MSRSRLLHRALLCLRVRRLAEGHLADGAGRALAYLYLVTLVGVLSSVSPKSSTLGILKLLGSVAILAGVYLARWW